MSRSISHFKCKNACFVFKIHTLVKFSLYNIFYRVDEGRWNCRQLLNNESFIPTEENAASLENWCKNFGTNNKSPNLCGWSKEKGHFFHMATCGVNCYIQWFAGLSCSLRRTEGKTFVEKMPFTEQYHVAKAKLLRYNFVVISEMLKNPEYSAAVERFFGVPGVAQREYSPWCEAESHYTNKMYPLVMKSETLKELTTRNRLDIQLYNEFKDCLTNSEFNFPAWNGNRFETNATRQVDYRVWEERNPTFWPTAPKQTWLNKFNNVTE